MKIEEMTWKDIINAQDIREAIELGLHMNLDNDLEVLFLIQKS